MALRITAGLGLACALLLWAALVATAQEPTPLATVGPPPTPPAGAPAAPSDLFAAFGTQLSWTDNSDNEDGFRITRRVFGGSVPDRTDTYEVGANVTSFALPADAPRLCGDEGYTAFDLRIVAFNTAGESAAETYGLLAECELAPTSPVPSPTAETSLPRTGLRGETTSWRSPYLQTMIASFLAATVVLGLALRAGGRRR
jgi:hypothetical protein